MCADLSLHERFWRDVAIATGHGQENLDPRAIREAVQDMMRNYELDEVPGFETPDSNAGVPDTTNFSQHSAFAPVFRIASRTLSSLGCCNVGRPIFVNSRRLLRRRTSHPEPPDHFSGGGNPGIQADQPTLPTPAVHGVSPWHLTPRLPPWTPQHYVWAYPTGHLAWSPHLQLSPFVPACAGLPSSMPPWTPGTWPPLDWARDVPIRLSPYVIPNPNNPHLPLIDWNVSKHPLTAKRLTPNHVVVDMDSIWGDGVTHTNANTIVVTCDIGHASTLWGPIFVKREGSVTLRDLFDVIYEHFQVPLTYPEVRYVCNLHPSNYDRLVDAYHERCRESVALPGWEARQGFRRVDVLGDRKHWWGAWISSRHSAWWLNLGFVNPSHRVLPR